MGSNAWTLFINGQNCGELTLKWVDQPWFECAFHPTPNFDTYAATFHQEDAELQAGNEKAWEELFNRVSEWDIRLIDGINGEINNLLLHINDKNEARFRY